MKPKDRLPNQSELLNDGVLAHMVLSFEDERVGGQVAKSGKYHSSQVKKDTDALVFYELLPHLLFVNSFFIHRFSTINVQFSTNRAHS